MLAARKPSGKSAPEMFDDIPVLRRKWQAGLQPGDKLPRYEDVMLGSLGRLADHIVLLRDGPRGLEVSRTGRYAQLWLEHDRWDVTLDTLSPDCATSLAEAAISALSKCRPYTAVAHCVRNGMVRTYDLLALPTSSRWGHTLIGVYVNERDAQYNLLDAIFSTTGEGDQFEIDSDDRSLKLGVTAFGDIIALTVSDVTALKRREASFRLLFDNNPMPMWLFDAETTGFQSVNDAAVQHYGYDRETFLSMTLDQIWPEDERMTHKEALVR